MQPMHFFLILLAGAAFSAPVSNPPTDNALSLSPVLPTAGLEWTSAKELVKRMHTGSRASRDNPAKGPSRDELVSSMRQAMTRYTELQKQEWKAATQSEPTPQGKTKEQIAAESKKRVADYERNTDAAKTEYKGFEAQFRKLGFRNHGLEKEFNYLP